MSISGLQSSPHPRGQEQVGRPPVRRGHLTLVPPPPPPTVRARAEGDPTGRPRMRLTRRGRLVVGLLPAVLTAGVVLTAGATAAPGPVRTVTVEAGQTLSEVSRAQLPGLPAHEAVARIQLANGLSSLQLAAGQRLAIPAG